RCLKRFKLHFHIDLLNPVSTHYKYTVFVYKDQVDDAHIAAQPHVATAWLSATAGSAPPPDLPGIALTGETSKELNGNYKVVIKALDDDAAKDTAEEMQNFKVDFHTVTRTIIVGVSHYALSLDSGNGTISNLKYAAYDAQAFHEFIDEVLPRDGETLLNPPPL